MCEILSTLVGVAGPMLAARDEPNLADPGAGRKGTNVTLGG
jgi:hypothetical protein